MKSVHVVSFLFALLFCVMSCSQSQQRAAEHELPAAQPDIRGVITQVSGKPGDLRIMVEEDPADTTASANSAKASVRIKSGAQLLERSNNELSEIDPQALKEGARVSVWYDGPVMLSYPAQAGAKTVVLER